VQIADIIRNVHLN